MKDPRDEVCEKASDYLLALDSAEFSEAFGNADSMLADLRKAIKKWEASYDWSSLDK